ncbi:hypothetical protein DMA12_48905, partial [Amycolatopsis balhimycina DSM 5908]
MRRSLTARCVAADGSANTAPAPFGPAGSAPAHPHPRDTPAAATGGDRSFAGPAGADPWPVTFLF